MAPRPLGSPPMSRYGSQSPSLQGLERVMRERPTALETPRRPRSSRKSSTSSINKPLPPEPLAPLFASTPSPRSSPCPQTQTLAKPGSRSGSYSRPASSQTDRQHKLSSLQPWKGRESRAGPADQSPISVDRPEAGDPEPASYGRSPCIMSRATSIVDSYSRRNMTGSVARSGAPLIAPHARNSRMLSMQVERLQNFNTSNSRPELEESLHSDIIDEAKPLDQMIQRKDTLVYSFDTPTESDSQVVFQSPVWAMDSSETAEVIAMRYRDTLPPSPFSPASVYEDEENVSTPLIPVLPPLPINSPFRLTGSTLGVSDNISTSNTNSRKTSPRPLRPHDKYEHPSKDQGVRAFGSQASWEPGDDSVRPQQDSVSPVSLTRSCMSGSPHLDAENVSLKSSSTKRPLPSNYLCAMPKTPHIVSESSADRSPSSLLFVAGQRLDVSRSVSPLTGMNDPDGPNSCWSDDSDDAGRGLKSLGVKLLKRRKEIKSQSTTSTGSGISPTNTNISAPRGRSNSHRQNASKSVKERRSLSESLDESIGDMYDTLTKFSRGLNKNEKKLIQKEPVKGDVKNDQSSRTQLGLPEPAPSATALTTSDSSPAGGDIRKLLAKKSKTWSNPFGGTKGDVESGGEKSPKGDSGWLSKLRKKNKTDAQREKWREDLKRKIKVVQNEPETMMAIVATREMCERVAAVADEENVTIDHF